MMKKIFLFIILLTSLTFGQSELLLLFGGGDAGWGVSLDGTTEYASVRSNIASTGNELCTNQGFETNTSGWDKIVTATITRITSDSHSGIASAECVTNGSSNYVRYWNGAYTSNYPAAQHKFLLTFWGKTVSGDAVLTPSGNYCATYRINGVLSSTLALTSNWTYYEVEYTATTSGEGYLVSMFTTTAGTWRIDDVSIKPIVITDELASSQCITFLANQLLNNIIGNWASSGNHTGAYSTTDKFSGSGSMQVTSTGGGNASNCVSLLSTYFSGMYTMAAGTSYKIVFKARMTLATDVTVSIGGQSKTFTGISTTLGTFTTCVFNFTATANEIGVPIKIWLSQADVGYIDEIGVYETYPMELEAWFKTSTAGTLKYIISKQTGTSATTSAGYQLSITAANVLQFRFYDLSGATQTITGTTTVTDGKWHKVKVTYTPVSGATIMTLDNNAEASGTLNVGFTNNIQNFTIGRYSASGANYFNGYLGRITLKIGGEIRSFYKWEGATDADFLNDSGTYNNDLTGTGLTQSADQIKGDGKYVLD